MCRSLSQFDRFSELEAGNASKGYLCANPPTEDNDVRYHVVCDL